MLDAPSYPKAFLNYQGYRYEFYEAKLLKNKLLGKVKITKDNEQE